MPHATPPIFVAIGVVLTLSSLGHAEETQPAWRILNHQAAQAAKAGNYAKFATLLEQLRPLMPGNLTVLYNSAAADAKLGRSEAALSGLRALAGSGVYFEISKDEDFAALRKTTAFADIEARFLKNRKPVSRATLAFPLPEEDLLPEDIAYDPPARRFFIASVRKAKILVTDGKGNAKDFAKADWSVMALRVDAPRRILWAATAWLPHCEACKSEDKDKTTLLAFDLDTGALRQRVGAEIKGMFGDMTIGRNGDLFVSEGIHGGVYRLPRGAAKLVRLDPPGEFPSPQTPALSADEKTLFVPDYARGIAALDLTATTPPVWLKPAPGIVLNGIDGLYTINRSLIAVQNGTEPPRLIQISADLRSQRVIESATPGLGEPTHGTFVGNSFYFLANTGWSTYDDDGKRKPGSPPVKSGVWRVELPLR